MDAKAEEIFHKIYHALSTCRHAGTGVVYGAAQEGISELAKLKALMSGMQAPPALLKPAPPNSPSDYFPTAAMEDAFYDSLPRRRGAVDHPSDLESPDLRSLPDGENFQKAFLAALAAAPIPADMRPVAEAYWTAKGGEWKIDMLCEFAVNENERIPLYDVALIQPPRADSNEDVISAAVPICKASIQISDSRIKELVNGIDFSQMVTADDLFYLIARAIIAEINSTIKTNKGIT